MASLTRSAAADHPLPGAAFYESGWEREALMSCLLRRFRVMFSVFYAVMVEYRAELALWSVATSIPLIMMGVWTQLTGEAGSDAALLPGGDTGFIRYFLAVFLIRQFTIVWVIHDFEWHVLSGRLSPLLLQPANPHWRFVTAHFAEQLAKLPFTLAILGLCVYLYPQSLWGSHPGDTWLPSLTQIAAFLFFVAWAFALRYLMQNLIAILAFWVERVVALDQLMFLPYLFLSGMLAPLEAFPEWARDLALLTPFPYCVWLPARLLVDPAGLPVLQGILVMTTWTAALALANRAMWRAGLKHYSAMGA